MTTLPPPVSLVTTAASGREMLRVENLNQYYGGSHILRNVDIVVREGACTVLLGRNGVGKSTLLKTIMGLVVARSGAIRFDGTDLTGLAPYQRVRQGIGYVPQGREIFNRLSVEENLLMGLAPVGGAAARKIPQSIFDMFPVLKQMLKRRGGDLSGGQQQQLAIGRALAANPRVLILDEPTEGIQPNIVHEIGEIIQRLNREEKLSVLLVEQKLPFARRYAHSFAVMEKGTMVASGKMSHLSDEIVRKHLSV